MILQLFFFFFFSYVLGPKSLTRRIIVLQTNVFLPFSNTYIYTYIIILNVGTLIIGGLILTNVDKRKGYRHEGEKR